jgi:hypothetical protein
MRRRGGRAPQVDSLERTLGCLHVQCRLAPLRRAQLVLRPGTPPAKASVADVRTQHRTWELQGLLGAMRWHDEVLLLLTRRKVKAMYGKKGGAQTETLLSLHACRNSSGHNHDVSC